MGFFSRFKKDTSEPELKENPVLSETKEINQQPTTPKQIVPQQPKTKGGLKMKHQIEIKLPKFLDPMFDNLTPEEKKKFGKVALLGGTIALGVSVIYLTGYNRGMRKAISDNGNRGIYIIKGGE